MSKDFHGEHKHAWVSQNCCHIIQFFAFQNFDKMCISNLMTILWTLDESLKKNSAKDESFVCDKYIWTKIIFIIKHEKWEMYFKSEIRGDFLYEILSEEWKFYQKR